MNLLRWCLSRTWLNVGALLIGVNVTIAFFLIVWLYAVKKIPSDQWEVHYPAAIPVATAAFIFGSFWQVSEHPVWTNFGVNRHVKNIGFFKDMTWRELPIQTSTVCFWFQRDGWTMASLGMVHSTHTLHALHGARRVCRHDSHFLKKSKKKNNDSKHPVLYLYSIIWQHCVWRRVRQDRNLHDCIQSRRQLDSKFDFVCTISVHWHLKLVQIAGTNIHAGTSVALTDCCLIRETIVFVVQHLSVRPCQFWPAVMFVFDCVFLQKYTLNFCSKIFLILARIPKSTSFGLALKIKPAR